MYDTADYAQYVRSCTNTVLVAATVEYENMAAYLKGVGDAKDCIQTLLEENGDFHEDFRWAVIGHMDKVVELQEQTPYVGNADNAYLNGMYETYLETLETLNLVVGH